MLRLYDNQISGNGYKVRLLLTQLGLPFERVEVDIFKGETRTPEFLALNPNGRIPTLRLEDGSHLAESNAILYYLAEGTEFWPDGRKERAETLQWLFFEQYSHEPYIATSRFIIRYLGTPPERAAELDQKKEGGYGALGIMEDRLAKRDFLSGGAFSIADIALFAYTHVADEGGFSLDDYPAVRAWIERIRNRENFVAM